MLTITRRASARAARRRSAPSRGSSPAGSSLSSAITCAETRSAGARGDVRDADRALLARARRSHARPSSGWASKTVARGEVEEVLPRALGAPVAEALELRRAGRRARRDSTQSTISSSRARAVPVTQVDERVRVGGDEVDRPVRRAPCSASVGAHRRPPAARHAARSRPAMPPSIRMRRFSRRSRDLAQAARRARRPTPRAAAIQSSSAPPSALGARRPASGVAVRQVGRAQQHAQLVPLDLVGDERRDQVVEVRRRGEQHGHRAAARRRTSAAAGRAPRAASQSSIGPIPARAKTSASWPITITRACQIVGRQPPHRVQERAEVELLGGRPARAGSSSSSGATARARAAASRREERSSVVYVRW